MHGARQSRGGEREARRGRRGIISVISLANAPLTLAAAKESARVFHAGEPGEEVERVQRMAEACYAREDYKEGKGLRGEEKARVPRDLIKQRPRVVRRGPLRVVSLHCSAAVHLTHGVHANALVSRGCGATPQ